MEATYKRLQIENSIFREHLLQESLGNNYDCEFMEILVHILDKHASRKKKYVRGKYLPEVQTSRSSRPKVFCKKGFLKDFANFPGKHLFQRLFFNKAPGLQLY